MTDLAVEVFGGTSAHVGDTYPPWLIPMQIDSKLLKNAFFVGVEHKGAFVPAGTGFLVAVTEGRHTFIFVVTAEHVISGLKGKGFERLLLRMNAPDGTARIFGSDYAHWHFHPDPNIHTDVAVASISFNPNDLDPLFADTSMFVTPDKIADWDISVGDEVAIVGLFRSHFGKSKNVPVVRIGNISAMPDEPVYTDYCGYTDAYLIEARSIAGLSGSPVWYNRPPVRVKSDQISYAKGERQFLLGLMHGHFDVKNMKEDLVTEDAEGGRGVNTGIGVVIPAFRIIETLNHPELIEMRKNFARQADQTGAKPDAVIPAEASKGAATDVADAANPHHKEDFTRLLGAAAKKQPRGD